MQYTARFFMHRSILFSLLAVCMAGSMAGCLPDYNIKITKGVQPGIRDHHLASADGLVVRTTQVDDESKSFGLLVLPGEPGFVVGVRDDEDVRIQRLDTLFQLVWERKLVIGNDDHDNILDFFHHGTYVIVVESRQTDDSIRYLAAAYDVRSGDPAWNAVLATVPERAFEDDDLFYGTILSPDSSSFLLYGYRIFDDSESRDSRTLKAPQDKIRLKTILFSAAGNEVARRNFVFNADSSGHFWNEHLGLGYNADLYVVNTRSRQTMEAERYDLHTGAKQRLSVELPGMNFFEEDSSRFRSLAYLGPGRELLVCGIRESEPFPGGTLIPGGTRVHGLMQVKFDFNRMAADIPLNFIPDEGLAERLFDAGRFERLDYRGWIPFPNGNGGCFALEWGGWLQEDMVSQHYALLAFDAQGKELWQATVPKSQTVYFNSGSRSMRTLSSGIRFDSPAPNLLSLSNRELNLLNISATNLPTTKNMEIFYVDRSNNGLVRWQIRHSDGLITGPERIAWIPGNVAIPEAGIRRLSPNSLLLLTYYKQRFDLNLVRVFNMP